MNCLFSLSLNLFFLPFTPWEVPSLLPKTWVDRVDLWPPGDPGFNGALNTEASSAFIDVHFLDRKNNEHTNHPKIRKSSSNMSSLNCKLEKNLAWTRTYHITLLSYITCNYCIWLLYGYIWIYKYIYIYMIYIYIMYIYIYIMYIYICIKNN